MQIVSSLRGKFGSIFKKRNWPYIFFAATVLFLFLANTIHESYPDEFDNILGGWYIIHGKIIYKDFFTHHDPFTYYLAGIIELISGRSFVAFRYVYALFLFLFTFGSYAYLKNSIKSASIKFYLAFILVFGIGATYFWGHMLLADNLAAILLTPVFALVFIKSFYRQQFTIKDYTFISILTSLTLLSAVTYFYLIFVLMLYLSLHYLFSINFSSKKFFSKNTGKLILIFIAPYLLFLIYLLITASLKDYFYDAITFNQKYYIYNYPRPEGSTDINPIRYAIVIAQNFQDHFSSLLIQAKSFNFSFPFNISLAVGSASLIIFLLIKKRFDLALLLWVILTFANARSNPLTSSETDYQSSVYIMISIFVICFFISEVYEELKKDIDYPKKLILSSMLLIVGIYGLFNFTFLVRKFSEKTYDKFMGFQATIYDRPRIAPIVNSLVAPADYAWIGPFEFEELFYLNAQIPSKYMILLPAFGSAPEIQQKMLSDFQKNPPKIIYFDKRFFILGRSPEMYAQFFLDYLNKNYITLYQYRKDKTVYKSSLPIDNRIDLETKLYINKRDFPQIKQELLDKGLIYPQ